MKSWEKFLEKKRLHEDLLRSYTKLRKLFQKYEWSEKDLESPPFYSAEMMRLRDDFNHTRLELIRKLMDFGFTVDSESFAIYLGKYMSKINELTPLKDGNNKRRNQGDEDFE
jgi:hypothetical protein